MGRARVKGGCDEWVEAGGMDYPDMAARVVKDEVRARAHTHTPNSMSPLTVDVSLTPKIVDVYLTPEISVLSLSLPFPPFPSLSLPFPPSLPPSLPLLLSFSGRLAGWQIHILVDTTGVCRVRVRACVRACVRA